MFDWIKNKAFNLRWLDDSLEFLSHQGSSEEVERLANKVAVYIWIGLFRIESEGMSPKFFTELYRKGKDDAVSKYQLQSVRHIEFAAPYIAMQFFLGIQLVKDVPNAQKVLARILTYIQSNCKNEETANYILTKFGLSLPPKIVQEKEISKEGASAEELPFVGNTQDPTVNRLMSNWRLHINEYESLGEPDQETVKREIYRVFERTVKEHPNILSIDPPLLISILNAYHLEFREMDKVNKLKSLAGFILIIAYKLTILCSNEVAESINDFAFSLVAEGKDLVESNPVEITAQTPEDKNEKDDDFQVIKSHPILSEYIEHCRNYNALSVTSKYEAIITFYKIHEAVFFEHGYVTCSKIFNEEQFFNIRKTIQLNSSGTELENLMGEFLWSTLLCLRFGEAGLNSIAEENFGVVCLSEEDCSYEEFVLDPEIQNVKIPEGHFSINRNPAPTEYSGNAVICPSCKKCVRLFNWLKINQCRFCDSSLVEHQKITHDKDVLTAQIEEILYNRPKTKQVRRIDAHSDAVIDSVQANPRSQFEKAVRCFMCGFSFQVDVLDRQANCPTCNQQITIV